MTEAEWLACDDPERMLQALETHWGLSRLLTLWDFRPYRLSQRKLRLMAVASARRVWPLLSEE